MPENPPIHAILNAVTDEKPKIFQSGRDIIYSLAAILAVMIASVAFTGMCSYGRNTPQNTPVVKVDAATFFNLEARASNFPIRLPQVPDDWTPNSARRGAVAGQPAPTADGYDFCDPTEIFVLLIAFKIRHYISSHILSRTL